MVKVQRCTLSDGRFIQTVEDCTKRRIGDTCIYLETGKDDADRGHLTLKVKGEVQFEDQIMEYGTTWKQCFSGFVSDFKLSGSDINAWAGKITITYNGKSHKLYCDDCEPGTGPADMWVFDGNDDGDDLGEMTCLNGKECAIIVAMDDSCHATEVSADECGGVRTKSKGTVTFSINCKADTTVSFEGVARGSHDALVNWESKHQKHDDNGVAQEWRGIGSGTNTMSELSQYQWKVAAGLIELDLTPTQGSADLSTMRIIDGSDVCTFERSNAGAIPESAIGMNMPHLDHSHLSNSSVLYSMQSVPYQVAIHGLALFGTFVVATSALSFLRPKQDYETISEHDI